MVRNIHTIYDQMSKETGNQMLRVLQGLPTCPHQFLLSALWDCQCNEILDNLNADGILFD
jgi:hypothetical protein